MSASPLALLANPRLQPCASEPYFIQLQWRIEALVRSGVLPAGTLLPSERELAGQLQIGRGIVRRCYAQLRDAGLLDSKASRHGTIVRGDDLPGSEQKPPPPLPNPLACPSAPAPAPAPASATTPSPHGFRDHARNDGHDLISIANPQGAPCL